MGRGAKKEVNIYLRARDKMAAGLKSASARVGRFAKSTLKHLKTIAIAAALTITAIGGASIAIGASFEQGMANVASVTRATATEMQALEDQARGLGATTAFTAREATGAMYALGSAGLDTGQIISATEGVLKLAGATMSDMATAAELNVSTLKQFGLEAEETDRVVNAMAAGIQNSMLNMERLTYSMQFAGPAAASVGMGVEETVAALGLLHNAGLKGSLAGTGLRMVMVRLLKPTADLKKVLGDVTITGDGFAAVLEQISKARLTPEQMVEMFGPRAYGAMRAFLVAGRTGFDQMTQAVTGTTAAFTMYDTQMDTVLGRWRIFRSALEETGLVIYDQLKPALGAVLDWAIAFVNENRDRLIPVLQNVIIVGITAGAELRAGFEHAKLAWLRFVHSVENKTTLVGKAIGWLTGQVVGIFDAGEAMTTEQIETARKGLQAEAAELNRTSALLMSEYAAIKDDRGWKSWVTAPTARQQEIRDQVKVMAAREKAVLVELESLADQSGWGEEAAAMQASIQAIYGQRDRMIDEFKRLWGKGDLNRAVKESLGAKFYEEGTVGPFTIDLDYRNKPIEATDGFIGPQMPMPTMADAAEEDAAKVLTAATRAAMGVAMVWRRGWDSIIETSMTGSEKWAEIWMNLKRVAWRYIGDIVTEQIKAQAKAAMATVASESAQTTAVVAGGAARSSAAASETAANEISTISRLKNAAAGFFSAFSFLGPLAIPAAIASIALMIKAIQGIGKMAFYDGGWVGGPSGRDKVGPAWLTRDEFVMPVAQSRSYASELEAMRDGSYSPSVVPVAAGQSGGNTINIEVKLETKPGTVITASDRLGIRRLTETIADDLVTVLKQNGVELSPA